ncbi:cysteine dioxygenase family protein [Caballeronia sp. ATUFL_F1_KS4A]|uniref:cysteine dioxygenase family protein n=1 Tax=Caballeronia sp. ATUFL_F1_KS4A TaxID=2921768 RepID=UPI0020278057|nr:cysteine dioxygenase family protein [Caballeronia sp. ATUFL_F1_KS4A]
MRLEHVSRLARPSSSALAASPAADCAALRSPALERLCREIDAAFATAEADSRASFGERVRLALQRAIADPGLLRPDQRVSDPRNYCRHLLAADPLNRYAIAALVWEPGQASPVHGHRTWCGYAVIDGALEETLYRWDAVAHRAIETRRHPRAPGAVSYVDAGRGAIHQLGNPADAAARAVSLHVYGVAGEQIATHVNDLLAA